jgi:DNA-binding transcriptional LysR family regulator
MDLNEIAIFIKVVEKKSFVRASEELLIPTSTVSRKVAELEKKLGVALLKRTTRKLSLTEYGKAYYENCSNAINKIYLANQEIQAKKLIPHGKLRISAPISVGTELIYYAINAFLKKYKDIQIELVLDNKYVDHIYEDFDIIFRADPSDNSNLKTLKIGTFPYVLCASYNYLETHKEPISPYEIKNHNCIIVSNVNKIFRWDFIDKNGREVLIPVSGQLLTNDLIIAKKALAQDLGIAYLPYFVVKDLIKNNVVKVLLKDFVKKGKRITYFVFKK